MSKHEGPKNASEIRVCYTPKEYVEAGKEIMKVRQDIFLEKQKKKTLGKRIAEKLRNFPFVFAEIDTTDADKLDKQIKKVVQELNYF